MTLKHFLESSSVSYQGPYHYSSSMATTNDVPTILDREMVSRDVPDRDFHYTTGSEFTGYQILA